MTEAYDAGLLGGGDLPNADWWQDYIRAELGRAHDHYEGQIDALISEVEALREAREQVCLPIYEILLPEDIQVFRGNVPRPGYPRSESTARLVSLRLLKNFESNTPLGDMFAAWLSDKFDGQGSARAVFPKTEAEEK